MRHKVAKHLGGEAARKIPAVELPRTDHVIFTSGLDAGGVESLISILSALREWRGMQAARCRVGSVPQDLPVAGKLPTTPR